MCSNQTLSSSSKQFVLPSIFNFFFKIIIFNSISSPIDRQRRHNTYTVAKPRDEPMPRAAKRGPEDSSASRKGRVSQERKYRFTSLAINAIRLTLNTCGRPRHQLRLRRTESQRSVHSLHSGSSTRASAPYKWSFRTSLMISAYALCDK